MIKEKAILSPKWRVIKEMYQKGTNGLEEYGANFTIEGELDQLCLEFLDLISNYTLEYGYRAEVEGIKLDLWKERIWALIENAGLLPPIIWREELEDEWQEEILDGFEEWDEEEIIELAPLETTLTAKDLEETVVPVKLHSILNEMGTLELWCETPDSKNKWKLEFNLRGNE